MRSRRLDLAADLFTAAVVASVGIALAGLTWRLFGDTRAALPPAGAAAPAGGDIAPLIALAPFGHPAAQAVRPTTLPLQLRGVLLAVPRNGSTAWISSDNYPARPFRTGEKVANATLVEVALDHVLLDNGGRTERLDIARAGAASTPSTLTSPAASAAPPLPAALGQIGTPLPGQGFRVGGDPPLNLLAAGVQPGDLIVRVNGVDLSDPARAREVIGAAALAGGARVELIRGGRLITVAIAR